MPLMVMAPPAVRPALAVAVACWLDARPKVSRIHELAAHHVQAGQGVAAGGDVAARDDVGVRMAGDAGEALIRMGIRQDAAASGSCSR